MGIHPQRRIGEERVDSQEGTRLWATTQGCGLAIVLNHGGPGARDDLQPLAEMIDDIALVHRYDQRGGGRSPSRGPFMIEQFVSDLEELRQFWNHDRWVVAGHSWGAHLALFYALAHPGRTAGLIFISGPPLTWGWGPTRRETRLTRLTAHERLELAELEAADPPDDQAVRRLRELWWLTDFADRASAIQHAPLSGFARSDALIDHVERDWQRQLSTHLRTSLPSLDIPALVLHGEADPLPASGPHELAGLLPKAV